MKKIIKKIIETFLLYSPVILGILIVLFFTYTKTHHTFDKGKTSIITSSTLMDAIDISELSTAQYTYNGIAEIYKDEKKEKVKCYIKYNAKVKAGIDMEQVKFEIDDKNKTVTPILPEIQITSNTVDENDISFIPEDVDIELKDALVACEEDAKNESQKSTELIDSARENLKSIIQGLIDPILTPNGYSIKWN